MKNVFWSVRTGNVERVFSQNMARCRFNPDIHRTHDINHLTDCTSHCDVSLEGQLWYPIPRNCTCKLFTVYKRDVLLSQDALSHPPNLHTHPISAFTQT